MPINYFSINIVIIEKVLQCFNMKNCKLVNTPLAAHFKISADHRRGVKLLNTSPMYHILA